MVMLVALCATAASAGAAPVPDFMQVVSGVPVAFEAAATGEGPAASTSFGAVRAGALARRDVTVVSLRGGAVEDIRVAGGRNFAVVDPRGCRGAVLPAGGSCTVIVVVSAPRAAAEEIDDRLEVVIDEATFEGQLAATT